jgi:hypothetical protein
MARIQPLIPCLFLVGLMAGCSSVRVQRQVSIGEEPLFQPTRTALGLIAVQPETRWRPDEKEPQVREKIAMAAISDVFNDLPTAHVPRSVP